MVVEITGLRLAPSAAMKEKRLAALLAGRDAAADPALAEALVTAQVRGSLELAGKAGTPEEADAAAALRRAVFAVDARAPLTVEAILTWQAALTGERALRRQARDRPGGPPAAPPEFVASRLAIVQEWLGGDSARELKAAQQGALVYARIMEILPFDRGNGLVARLAASHLMTRAGSRRPILVGGDAGRLEEALQAAFQLQTEPLARLLDDAAERALDVLIGALS
ncbi:MAG TPA: Fic family protein [Vicinamibacteria bacterium]|nr:Fic family protein [Vicinamibacteria bacterium]